MRTNFPLLLFSLVVMLGSCGSRQESAEQKVTADSTAVYQEYTCPMHPEIISNQPGKCPNCSMELQIKS